MPKHNFMKKLLFCLLLIVGYNVSYSQKKETNRIPTVNEFDTEYYKEYKKITDSLSKVYNLHVEGYFKSVSNDTIYTTIFYRKDKRLLSLGPIATPLNLPNSGTNRAVNPNRQ